KKKYIIAHDTGTGGDKAVITDTKGTILYSAYHSYPLIYSWPGWVEQDPEVIWEAVAKTTCSVIKESGIEPGDIIGFGITAQMFNLLPVDEKGKPLMNMISWLDERSIDEADKLTDADERAFFYDHSANIPMAKDIIPKIIWLRKRMPDIWRKTYKLLDCKEYLIHKLTGKFIIDRHGASVFFLLDPYTGRWSLPLLDKLNIPLHMLPEIRSPAEVIGTVTEKAAHTAGLKPGTPVVLCAGDVAAAQTGSGAGGEGMAHLCLGTATWIGVSSGQLYNNREKPFWALQHADHNKYIIAGEMETGGGALMWLREKLLNRGGPAEIDANAKGTAGNISDEKGGIMSYEVLNDLAEQVKAGAEHLIFAPWLSGERAPVLDHYARGAFIGIGLNHGKGHFIRAVMEGVGYQLKWIIDEMEKTGLNITTIHAVGGGIKSMVWPRIISDILGRDLSVVKDPVNAGAVGAAFMAAVGLGLYGNTEETDGFVGISNIVKPCKENREVYDNIYPVYRRIYDALSPIFPEIKKLGTT
ncbi:MAG: hypothetical protein GXP33_16610, partial [Spirochaetes bacterium]|nr:hypothetical protein [Spirochaetota bacterium]